MHTATHDRRFHDLHAAGILLLANAWDAGSARIVAALGAPAIATSSAALAWSQGYPDGGTLPQDKLLAATRSIAAAVDLPLTVDIEDGGDDPAATRTLVHAVIDAGAVGINIEDGGSPPELLCRKIAAARAVARERGIALFVNARTDVFLRGESPAERRVEETLARATQYREAGADGLFVPGLLREDDIEAIAAGAGMPLNVMALPGLAAPERLSSLGVRRLSAGSAIGEAAFGTVQAVAEAFLRTGAVTAPTASPGYAGLNALMSAATHRDGRR